MEMKKCDGKCCRGGNEKSRYRKRGKYSRMTALLVFAALLFLECPSVKTLSADANAMQMQDMGKSSSAAKTVYKKVTLEPADLRCGNTVKIVLPQEVPAQSKLTYASTNRGVADVEHGVIVAYAPGTAVISITAEYEKQVWEFEQSVTVKKAAFQLKVYANNSYLIDSARSLAAATNMSVAKGKTARMRAIVGKGCITGISFYSSDESVATVKKDGAYCKITGVNVGKAVVTAVYEIGTEKKELKMNVSVTSPKIPVSNPVNASRYNRTAQWQGDYVYFGRFEQDNDLSNGSEMILWRVLQVTEDSIMLLSDSLLASRPYQETFEEANWRDSDIRAWLNSEFMSRAFTGAEVSAMLENEVTTAANPVYSNESEVVTKDYVYLLSSQEVTNPVYGFYPSSAYNTATRKAVRTEYALANDGDAHNCWWLRDNSLSLYFGAYISSGGKVIYESFVGRRNDGVRPVICLDLSKISFAVSGDGYPVVVVD